MIAQTTHATIQELAALDATAQAAAHELRAAVTQLELERSGVQTRIDATGLDDNMTQAAGARERLLRLNAAILSGTTRRDAAITRANETARDLQVAQNELDRAHQWLDDLRTATSPQAQQLTIRGWRFELERCQEVIRRRTGQWVDVPSVPPETDGTKWQEMARSEPLVLPELVS